MLMNKIEHKDRLFESDVALKKKEDGKENSDIASLWQVCHDLNVEPASPLCWY